MVDRDEAADCLDLRENQGGLRIGDEVRGNSRVNISCLEQKCPIQTTCIVRASILIT